MLIKVPRGWEIPESRVTPEAAYFNRREILAALAAMGCGPFVVGETDPYASGSPYAEWFPVPRNEAFQVPERPVTDEYSATTFNNYYEFTGHKPSVWQLVDDFEVEPWTITVDGLCNNPGTYDLEDFLNRFQLEERIYRFRCVEAWAMTVPWSGFTLSQLVAFADPTSDARYVRLQSENRPDVQPGANRDLPWPYVEGLSLDEATNDLTLMVAGMYGKAAPVQNGAPLRLIVPWKYGFKSAKSIVRITFTADEPATFWPTLVPHEYGFVENVDPDVPHPRWSQAEEWLVPDGETLPTLKFNGYGEWVAGLYG